MGQPAITTGPVFPPVFTATSVPGPVLAPTLAAACSGAGAGTFFWSTGTDQFEAAVVFEPEEPLRAARIAHLIAMLGIADALGALGPPYKPVTFEWPDLIRVDGGVVGRVRLFSPEQPDDQVAPWLVAAVALRMRFSGVVDDPGRTPDRTALYEEGFGEVEVPELAEAFARHLLTWVHRWEEGGAEAIANEWLTHLPHDLKHGDVRHGIDPTTGDLLLLDKGALKPRRRDLAAALMLSAQLPERQVVP